MYIGETGGHFSYQPIISPEIELRIFEEHFKLLLEFLNQVILDHSNLHVRRKQLIELIISQESVRTDPKMRQGVKSPKLNDIAFDSFVRRQLLPDLDNEILEDLHHVVGVLLRSHSVVDEEALNFLDGHRVEEHAEKLKQDDPS